MCKTSITRHPFIAMPRKETYMKKSLSAIFCLVIMLSLSVPVSASAFDSSNYASSNSSAVAQSQYEMLMDSFGFDSSLSDIVYPSNYGGAYINSEGALVVMQTNSISSSSRGGNFASVLNEAGSFILDTVSYSYNELNSLKSAYAALQNQLDRRN